MGEFAQHLWDPKFYSQHYKKVKPFEIDLQIILTWTVNHFIPNFYLGHIFLPYNAIVIDESENYKDVSSYKRGQK